MSSDKSPATAKLDRILADAQRSREEGYRDKALKMYPHVCGRCTREFSGKRLSELTVHHRDHNHDNNPTDGSNWELLCLYCHDTREHKCMDIHPNCHTLWTYSICGVGFDKFKFKTQFGGLPSRAADARRRAAARRRVN